MHVWTIYQTIIKLIKEHFSIPDSIQNIINKKVQQIFCISATMTLYMWENHKNNKKTKIQHIKLHEYCFVDNSGNRNKKFDDKKSQVDIQNKSLQDIDLNFQYKILYFIYFCF